MPRSIAMSDQPLPRRRKAAASSDRGLIMQIIFHSPKDTLAGALALTAVLAIIVNAMFMQAGRHPSPLFGTMLPVANGSAPPTVQRAVAVPAVPPQPAAQGTVSPIPRPRPAEADMRRGDPLGNLVRKTSLPTAADEPRPPAAVPARSETAGLSSQQVAAVQRALTDYGYGQIKATGTVGVDTQGAILKFERERRLPLTGQMSERLVRELGLATGRSFE